MNSEKLTPGALARYLADECSHKEYERVEQWVKESKENAQKLKEFNRIWNTAEVEVVDSNIDIDQEWDELNKRLKEEVGPQKEVETSVAGSNIENGESRVFSIHSTSQQMMRYAAIFLVVGFLGFLSYQSFYQPETKDAKAVTPALREISTDNGQRVDLTLSDGSKVLLNAGSTLKLPKKFGPDVRKVFLEGEAYFEVAANKEKPFKIYSQGSVTRVLGTSFTVRAYEEEGQVQVVVKEGKVTLKKDEKADSPEAVLEANELGQYQVDTQNIQSHKVEDMQLYLGWIDGYLKFRNAPMTKVARELERRYGVEVTFEDQDIKQKKLTAILKSRSIRSVLDVITMTLDVEYRLDKDNLTFYK